LCIGNEVGKNWLSNILKEAQESIDTKPQGHLSEYYKNEVRAMYTLDERKKALKIYRFGFIDGFQDKAIVMSHSFDYLDGYRDGRRAYQDSAKVFEIPRK